MGFINEICCVLASPSDVSQERQIVREKINLMNTINRQTHIRLNCWENTLPNASIGGAQQIIDDDLDIANSDMFICIFGKRIGTDLLTGLSGTESELDQAFTNFHISRKPRIHIFFKQVDEENVSDKDQYARVKKIKERCADQTDKYASLYCEYRTIREFEERIVMILMESTNKATDQKQEIAVSTNEHHSVSSFNEFVNNLKSGASYWFKKSILDLLDESDFQSEFVRKENSYDGEQIVISNVKNIVINGNRSMWLIKPRYSYVLTFENCSNIRLESITLGHAPELGACAGGVISLKNCHNIEICSCSLFGCGTYGIEIENSSNITCENVSIYNCSCGISEISDSTDIVFKNCQFYENHSYDSCLRINLSGRVQLQNVAFRSNSCKETLVYYSNNPVKFGETFISFVDVNANYNYCSGFSNVNDGGVKIGIIWPYQDRLI